MICKLVASAFVLADFYPPPCFVKFIGYVWASPAAFRVGPMGQMEGNWFHLCASALFHACAEGLAVADEFHVPQSFRLAAAIAPRRREKSARHQFSPLGKASCVLEPDADCGRGRLVPRFRLASRSAASGGTSRGCNCASQTGKVCLASIQSAWYGKLRAEAGGGLRAREAIPPFSPREPQCRIRRGVGRMQYKSGASASYF